jgi:hypothetical protein
LFKDLTSCDLYDISGKLIFSKINWVTITYSFSTSNLRDGVYIVKMVTSDKIETGTKIIVETNCFRNNKQKMRSIWIALLLHLIFTFVKNYFV